MFSPRCATLPGAFQVVLVASVLRAVVAAGTEITQQSLLVSPELAFIHPGRRSHREEPTYASPEMNAQQPGLTAEGLCLAHLLFHQLNSQNSIHCQYSSLNVPLL